MEGVNVTPSVIHLAKLILREVFGEVVEAVAGELLQWNNQHLGTLFKSQALAGMQGKQGQQKLCEALMVLIHHNLVTFSRNEDDRFIRYKLNVDRVLNVACYPRYMLLAKTLFGDEGEILTEELLSRGQDCASNLICRAARRLGLSKANINIEHNKEIAEIVNKLYKAFKELTSCHFIGRVESPYSSDEKLNAEGLHNEGMPLLNMPQTMKYKCQDLDITAMTGKCTICF